MCAVHLVEAPKEVFRRTVHVFSARVIWEVLYQGRLFQFLSEEIDFVEEQDDGCSHEPSRVDNRVKEYERLHHAVLQNVSWVLQQCLRKDIPGCSLPVALDRTR